MRLEYKILWVEDDVWWLDETEIQIWNSIKLQNHIPEIEKISTNFQIDKIIDKLRSTEYDIIFIDFSLATWLKWDKVIEAIRNHDIYTDILFYSNSPEEQLLEEIHSKKLEWVYVCHKKVFEQKVDKLLGKTIWRNYKPNNFRWLLMHESCEIELKINDIIIQYYRAISWDEKIELIEEIIDTYVKVEERYRKSYLTKSITEIVEDSNFRAKDKITLLKWLEVRGYFHDYDIFLALSSEVFDVRNNMWHARIKCVDGVYSYYDRIAARKITLDNEYIDKVKHDLIKHKNNFNI